MASHKDSKGMGRRTSKPAPQPTSRANVKHGQGEGSPSIGSSRGQGSSGKTRGR